jgi:hypothetical protein
VAASEGKATAGGGLWVAAQRLVRDPLLSDKGGLKPPLGFKAWSTGIENKLSRRWVVLLQVLAPALNQKEARKLAGELRGGKGGKDSRNLYLAKEGEIDPEGDAVRCPLGFRGVAKGFARRDAYDAGVWGWCIVQGPFSVAPCQTVAQRFAGVGPGRLSHGDDSLFSLARLVRWARV